jgi:hypothetical protein
MRSDLNAAASFHAAFEVAVFLTTTDKNKTHAAEKRHFADFKAQGDLQAGYNKLPAKPAVSNAFWYLLRRGMLQTQAANCHHSHH